MFCSPGATLDGSNPLTCTLELKVDVHGKSSELPAYVTLLPVDELFDTFEIDNHPTIKCGSPRKAMFKVMELFFRRCDEAERGYMVELSDIAEKTGLVQYLTAGVLQDLRCGRRSSKEFNNYVTAYLDAIGCNFRSTNPVRVKCSFIFFL